MGIAEGVPGVSGSTIAFLLGIYEKFIELLHSVSVLIKEIGFWIFRQRTWSQVVTAFRKIDFEFAVPLGIGTLLALGGFALAVDLAIEHYPLHVYGAFFGLSVASLFLPLAELKLRKIPVAKALRYMIIVVISLVSTILLLNLLGELSLQSNGFTPLYIFVGGFLAISGLVFPGVSGSFILLLLGLYEYVYTGLIKGLVKLELTTQQLVDVGIFILGVVVGFMVLVRLLKLALKNYRQELMSVVLGVLLASLTVLWPFMEIVEEKEVSQFPKIRPCELDYQTLITVILVIVVAALVGFGLLVFGRRNSRKS